MKFAPFLIASLAVIAAIPRAAVQSQPSPRPTVETTLLARPLFAPGRRPDPPDAITQAASAPAGIPRLSGIMVHGADRRAMFIQPDGQDRTETVSEGGQIGPYRIQTISLAAVTLLGPDGVQTLAPLYANGLATNPAPPPPRMVGGSPMPTPRYGADRFDAPAGPMGLAMYRFSPAAPRTPPPVPDALTAIEPEPQ